MVKGDGNVVTVKPVVYRDSLERLPLTNGVSRAFLVSSVPVRIEILCDPLPKVML